MIVGEPWRTDSTRYRLYLKPWTDCWDLWIWNIDKWIHARPNDRRFRLSDRISGPCPSVKTPTFTPGRIIDCAITSDYESRLWTLRRQLDFSRTSLVRLSNKLTPEKPAFDTPCTVVVAFAMFSPLIVIDSFGTVYLLGENAQEAIVGWFVLEACTDGEFS